MSSERAFAADPDGLKLFSYQVFSKLEGAVTAGMIHLGDRLGLYRALARAAEPMSSAELAQACALHERWVREWAFNQAAARLIVADTTSDPVRFSLTNEAVAVFSTPEHPAFGMGMFHRLPATMRSLEQLPVAFSSGIGFDYDSHGPDGAEGIEKSFEPWNNAFLIPVVLPALGELVTKLESGATVVDIGCGAGSAILQMARRFPKCTFVGYDISRHALERANDKLRESKLGNVSFHDPRNHPIPADNSVDFVTTFDCIHDMTRPQEMMEAIRAAIAEDGRWLLVDIKALDSFAENASSNPMASLMYGISVMSCMSSAMSDEGGAGLGTLGLSESVAREMSTRAGFTRFRRLDIDHSVNAFYEVRP